MLFKQEKKNAQENPEVKNTQREVEELRGALRTAEKRTEVVREDLQSAEKKLSRMQTVKQPAEPTDGITKQRQTEVDRLKTETAAIAKEEASLKDALSAAAVRNQEASRRVQQVVVKRYKLEEGEGSGQYELLNTLKK